MSYSVDTEAAACNNNDNNNTAFDTAHQRYPAARELC